MRGNQDLVRILRELAVLYSIKEIAFKPRAFERAADAVAVLGEDVRTLYRSGGLDALERIPGVGQGIAERIEEYVDTGRIAEYVRMKKALPVDIVGITAIEGIGPKTVVLLYKKLHIRTVTQLARAARAGKLATVRGIGAKGQERILRALQYQQQSGGRALPGLIWPRLREIADAIESWPHVKRVELVGSVRRMRETIGDLDMLAISDNRADTLRRFVSLPQVQSVSSHGDTKALVHIVLGMDADLWVMPAESFGAALIAWTGNKAHNIHLRTLAKKKGYMLDEFGLFKGTHMIAGFTEAEVYRKLGMAFIPPELREDTGEIEAAIAGTLPKLVGYGDMQGDLHAHSDWTDGTTSIEHMARAAQTAGLSYLAITDHTKSLTIAKGLDEKKIRKQLAEIDRVQRRVPKVKLLKGTECDILKDGTLDFNDAILAHLDVVNIAVHSHFNMTERAQTERIVRALQHPSAHVLCHPTGRLLEGRAPYPVDMAAVIAAAKRSGSAIELNSSPSRLDLKDEHVRMAVQAGVYLAINTDAHHPDDFHTVRWGIGTARRGWAEKKDILNTRTWQQMLKLLK